MRASVLILAGAAVWAAPVWAQVALNAREAISVTGDAEIKVAPDRVVLFLGVETRNKVLGAARSGNDERVRAVLAAAARVGVETGDVQTDFVQVEPVHDRQDGTAVDYYTVRKSIVVTVKRVERFEETLAAALDAGATHVHSVDFQTTELRRYRDEARALAVRAATEKARDMAAAAGLKVGAAVSISSYSPGYRSWYGSGWWGGGGRYGQMAQNVVQEAGGGEAGGTMALGRISVTAQVTMSFRVE